MAKPLYRIKDWDRNFENSESRKIKSLNWTPFPNRHDSAPFRRVASLKGAPEIFAAWVLIVQVASRMPARGVLENSSGPLDANDLAFMTGFPERVFALALEALQKPGIQWILAESGESPGIPGNFPTSKETPGLQGTEQKGTEQKGTEQKKEESVASLLADPLFLNPDFCQAWTGWESMRAKDKPKLTDHGKALNFADLKRLAGDDVSLATQIVNQSIKKTWKGFFNLKEDFDGKNTGASQRGTFGAQGKAGGGAAERRAEKASGEYAEHLEL